MIILKSVVLMMDIIFLTIFIAFILTLSKMEIQSNPIATAFFASLILLFAANTFLIFTI